MVNHWNEFETQLVGVTDEIVPYKLYEFKTVVELIPEMIKHKINDRRRLLKSNKNYTTVNKTERIKVLNKDIKFHFNKIISLKILKTTITFQVKIDYLTRVTCLVNFPANI